MTVAARQNPISVAERTRRLKAVDTARASVNLEGFMLDAQTEELNTRYVNGELSSAELTAEILKLSGR